MKNCAIVYYIALPFYLPKNIKHSENKIVKPILEGTCNMLSSINRTEIVIRIILAFISKAYYSDYIDYY
jgi:hypothetical protein